MANTDDTLEEGGAGLSIDQAANAYAKSIAPKAVPQDDATDDELAQDIEADADASDGADEAETGETDQAGDDEDEGNAALPDSTRIRLSDGKFTTLADLKQGSLRQSDYTRKTQEVAEQRRSVDGQSQRLQQQEQQLAERFQYTERLISSMMPPPPDPSMLQTDPMAYLAAKDQQERMAAHLNFIAQEQQRSSLGRQAETEGQKLQVLQREQEALVAKAPEFRDGKRLTAFANDIKSYGLGVYALKPEELQNVAMDHRLAVVLKDAIAWRKLQESKPKTVAKVEGRPPVQKGGTRLSPDGRRAQTANAAFAQAKKSGSVDDVTAAWLARQKG